MNRRNFLTGMAGILAATQAPALVSAGNIMRIKPVLLPAWSWVDAIGQRHYHDDSQFITFPCRNCWQYDCYGKCTVIPPRPDYDWIQVTSIYDIGEGAGWYRADGTETTNYLESRHFTSSRLPQRNP